jgi:phenylalanyl-tRNA synthetase beta chain
VKFSLDWIRSYVDLPEEPARVAELLAEAGLPVDTLERWGADTSLDVDVMANRPDCMCHVGLARELGARLRRPLTEPAARPARGRSRAAELATVEIEAASLCPRYSALVLTGVKVARSPDWLEDRLASIGQRPINNIVDVTNFVLHETGQPLHAFDLDRLEGRRIVVRPSREGETLQTLDGVRRNLRPADLVIADATRPVALAGVMGGADTEISAGTNRMLLESAHFDPLSVRRTARAQSLRTDASHRFERGSDVGVTLDAALRAAALIIETAGGELAVGDLDVQALPLEPRYVGLSLSRAVALLGLPLEAEAVSGALAALGFQVEPPEWSGGETLFQVRIPTWRVDVQRDVDLIEEIARMIGYDAVPATLAAVTTPFVAEQPPSALQDRARRFLAAAGFSEAINFPMSDGAVQAPFAGLAGAGGELVTIENPMSSQMDTMRASLIPGLVTSIQHNWNRGREDILLFETGRLFAEPGAADASRQTAKHGDSRDLPLPVERPAVAAVACGGRRSPHWNRSSVPVDAFDLKGVVEELAGRVLGRSIRVEPAAGDELPFLALGARAWVRDGTDTLGYLGRLDACVPGVAEISAEIYAFEIYLPDLDASAPPIRYRPLPRHPPAERDLALFLAAGVPYHELEDAIREAGRPLLESVRLFDRYSGHPVPAGQVSLAVRLVFRHAERTLGAEEVQAAQDRIVERLTTHLGAILRDS